MTSRPATDDAPPPRLGWRWLEERDHPRARPGDLGTVASCEPGDLVIADLSSGLAWALIAFRLNAGFDGRAAIAYVGGAEGVRQRVEFLQVLPSTTRVRFIGVRPGRKT